jgi:hypothetical protein
MIFSPVIIDHLYIMTKQAQNLKLCIIFVKSLQNIQSES